MLQLWHISQAARRQIAWIWLNHGLKQWQQQQHLECQRLCVSLCVYHFYYPYISVCRRVLLEPVILSVCAWKNLCFILRRGTFPAAPASVFHCSKCPLHFVCVYVCLSMRECVRRHPRTPDQSRLFTRRQTPVNFILKIALQYVHSARNGPDYNWRLTSQLPLPLGSVRHWHWELGKLTICTHCAGKYTIEELFLSAYIGFQLK